MHSAEPLATVHISLSILLLKMGKSETNPLMVSETESESDSDCPDCPEDKEDFCHDTPHSSHDESGSRGRPRRSSGSPVMIAPWAPSPYLRRAWTPEPKKRSSSKYKRSQSVPEPSCSDEIPARSAESKAAEKKAAAKRAAERVVQRWVRWQMFMKYLADEMYADGMANNSFDDEECDEKADCKQRRVTFTGKANFLAQKSMELIYFGKNKHTTKFKKFNCIESFSKNFFSNVITNISIC